jgi:hypothetical protein
MPATVQPAAPQPVPVQPAAPQPVVTTRPESAFLSVDQLWRDGSKHLHTFTQIKGPALVKLFPRGNGSFNFFEGGMLKVVVNVEKIHPSRGFTNLGTNDVSLRGFVSLIDARGVIYLTDGTVLGPG